MGGVGGCRAKRLQYNLSYFHQIWLPMPHLSKELKRTSFLFECSRLKRIRKSKRKRVVSVRSSFTFLFECNRADVCKTSICDKRTSLFSSIGYIGISREGNI